MFLLFAKLSGNSNTVQSELSPIVQWIEFGPSPVRILDNSVPGHFGTDLDISVLGTGHFGTDLDISVLGIGQFGTWMRQYAVL
jgi:hypothetical protein